MDKKKLLVVCRHSPYGTGLARAALDTALAAAAFEQPLVMVFVGEGVLQLIPDQEGSHIGRRDMARQLSALPLYDIEHVYVDADAAARYQIDIESLELNAHPVDGDELHALLCGADHLLGF